MTRKLQVSLRFDSSTSILSNVGPFGPSGCHCTIGFSGFRFAPLAGSVALPPFQMERLIVKASGVMTPGMMRVN